MRTIKFRIWNGKTKSWIHGPNKLPSLDGVNLFGETILFGDLLGGVSIEDLNDCEALQFTERKDKNGKEIFDGDVLKVSEDEMNKGSVHSPYCHVWCSNGEWVVSYNHQYSEVSENLSYCYYKYEVVGNIYDNEELIK